MILLDTNILSELMKPSPHAGVSAWVDARLETDLYICAITLAEIELGIALLPDSARRDTIAAAAQAMFDQFSGRCLVFGETAATQYARLVAHRRQLGRPIHVEDAQIAAIALAHGLRLATRNVKDFEHIPDLRTVDPWSAHA